MLDSESMPAEHPDSSSVSLIEKPPRTIVGILGRLGPGLIIAASIVGSGELIGTTKTGAEAGFSLLWLIIIGCVIKVFVQVEFGRYSIVTGKTTMSGLNLVPGPTIDFSLSSTPGSFRMRGNWIVWYWFLMWFASIGQLGGIVGGVGQAMAISWPLTDAGRQFNEYVDHRTQLTVATSELARLESRLESSGQTDPARVAELTATITKLKAWLVTADLELGLDKFTEKNRRPPAPLDDRLWATLIAVGTSVLLVLGRYGLIQHFSTLLVSGFTIVTVVNVIMLQLNPSWSVSADDILTGLKFWNPPQVGPGKEAWATALATFGIIGVGASELVGYPYWCLEKGYARFTGPRDDSTAWAERAHGWMRVLRWDAWCSMFIYTFATLAFYLLGAAILGRSQLNPDGNEMIRTLAVMYEPVFGASARILFLFGAFAVLYSTYFVANASHALVFSDALGVLGAAKATELAHRRRIKILSGFFPLLCLALYLWFKNPVTLVLVSGLMQSIMLPMLSAAALYFRYCRGDRRLSPGILWDVLLWISAFGMLVAGVWSLVDKL